MVGLHAVPWTCSYGELHVCSIQDRRGEPKGAETHDGVKDCPLYELESEQVQCPLRSSSLAHLPFRVS
jgi:hypothetical protein